MRIRTKIAGMSAVIVLITAASIVGITTLQRGEVEDRLADVVQQLARREAIQVAKDVYLMAKAMQESLDQTMAHNLSVAQYLMDEVGPVRFSESMATWSAQNQYTREVHPVALPKMTVGGIWLRQNRDLATETLVVDKVKHLVGGTCTIFQRMSANGDMLRVATNVETESGERAIGTYIPRWNPDGSENPVIATVLRGETFVGRAFVVNAWYVTAYKPIWNYAHDRVDGVLYVGIKEENLQSLKQSIRQIRLGKSGYAFVAGGSGDLKGHYIVSKDGRRDGENLWDNEDPAVRANARLIVNRALALKNVSHDGEIPVAVVDYRWQNPGDNKPRSKQVALTYFEPWDWVIGASFYDDDLLLTRQGITAVIDDMIRWISFVSLIIALVTVVMGLIMADSISQPLVDAVRLIKQLGRGRLDLSMGGRSGRQDEIGELSDAFNKMVGDLRTVTASRDELDAEISERKAVEHRLRENEVRLAHLAHHDALTGLPNRLLLTDRLDHAIRHADRRGGKFALMFLDLDRFKNINDTLGHAVGDELLIAIAQRLRRALRSEDTIARLGGDEFMIVLGELSSDMAAALVARKLLDEVSVFSQIGGHELFLTASLGIVIYPDNASSVDELMRAADIAMYQAKAKGRNLYEFYTPGMNARAKQLLMLEHELRKAFDEGQLELFYQPQFNLRKGCVVGAEVLVRWRHPVKGLISPQDFIFVAEDTGLIVPIGRWIFSEACRQARAWRDKGYPELPFAVNLSAKQFRHQELVDEIRQTLADHDIERGMISVELTESALMDDAERAVAIMQALRDLGIDIAIDDFGTGYSSLAYLKRFPLQKLKIDRVFVRDLIRDASDAAIVQATVALAKSLELEVVAEGIETREQLHRLDAFGCQLGQGYLFDPPLPADTFEARYLQPGTARSLFGEGRG